MPWQRVVIALELLRNKNQERERESCVLSSSGKNSDLRTALHRKSAHFYVGALKEL